LQLKMPQLLSTTTQQGNMIGIICLQQLALECWKYISFKQKFSNLMRSICVAVHVLQMVCTFNKFAWPVDANLTSAARSQQLISHITYSCVRRCKSTLV
jgi:hypothetical protein